MVDGQKVRENVKRLRIQRGVLQEEMAELLNIDRSAYSRRETGKIEFRITELQKIAEYFNVSINELIGED